MFPESRIKREINFGARYFAIHVHKGPEKVHEKCTS